MHRSGVMNILAVAGCIEVTWGLMMMVGVVLVVDDDDGACGVAILCWQCGSSFK